MRTVVMLLLAVFMAGTVWGTTVSGQIVEVFNNGSVYRVKIQLSVDVAAGLGGATLSFSFNSANLSFPASPVAGTDYTFHAFTGGNYSVSTVTRPAANRVTANIEYNGGGATLVNTTPTDVVTITFTTLNPAGNANLVWVTTQVLADDQTTPWGVGTFNGLNTTPLPIQLASFTATMQQEPGGVLLKWATASETNNYGFTVQRKGPDATEFTDLANSFLAGHGTTVEPQSYSYVDRTGAGGTYDYRLKQQDMDGTLHYSESVRASSVLAGVVEAAPLVFQLRQNYPNPFNPATTVKFSVESNALTTLTVYNSLGQEVATLFEGMAEAGRYYQARLDGRNLASGVYLYRLVSGKNVDVKRMLLLK